jgi:anti-sigma regulatory factor (Ser/Thr protein kinase)
MSMGAGFPLPPGRNVAARRYDPAVGDTRADAAEATSAVPSFTPSLSPRDALALTVAQAEAAPDGLLVVSPVGEMIFMNRRFGEVWGFPEELLRSRDDEAALASAMDRVADPDEFIRRVRAVYADGAAPTRDEILLRDGRVLDRYGAPLHTPDGSYLGWAWYFRDVTEQKRTEAELRQLAQTLQASLLPPRPPAIPGLEVATRYESAGSGLSVGGDFYDVFHLRTNDWGVAIGDVCGKGAQAAALTALVRYTLRAAAVHVEQPSAVLRELNEALLDDPELGERFCSAVFARIEQDVCGAWATLACAGHPQPVVVRRAGWIDVRGQPGDLLGLFPEFDATDDRVGLGPGDALVFFTDGIGETRNPAGEMYADEALPALLLSCTSCSADELAERLVADAWAFGDGPFSDDVAVLVLRVPDETAADAEQRLAAVAGATGEAVELPGYSVGEPDWGRNERPAPPREARLGLAGAATCAAAARQFVNGVVHSWRMSALAGGDAELLTGEVVANAVRHATGPMSVIVRYDGARVRVEVGDGAPALPRPRTPQPDVPGGWGLHIVEELAAGWGVTRTERGKRVWFELDAPPL